MTEPRVASSVNRRGSKTVDTELLRAGLNAPTDATETYKPRYTQQLLSGEASQDSKTSWFE